MDYNNYTADIQKVAMQPYYKKFAKIYTQKMDILILKFAGRTGSTLSMSATLYIDSILDTISTSIFVFEQHFSQISNKRCKLNRRKIDFKNL